MSRLTKAARRAGELLAGLEPERPFAPLFGAEDLDAELRTLRISYVRMAQQYGDLVAAAWAAVSAAEAGVPDPLAPLRDELEALPRHPRVTSPRITGESAATSSSRPALRPVPGPGRAA
ncbi:MAG TPA: hypothetical protein VGJ44_20270 [Kribbellaceae bacterium]|jgi:hypothetical protein